MKKAPSQSLSHTIQNSHEEKPSTQFKQLSIQKAGKKILDELDSIENESPPVESTEGEEGYFSRVYPDQRERMGQLLIDNYKNNFEVYTLNSSLALRAMFHFGADHKFGKIFYNVVKKYHQKEFREKCVDMTLMINRLKPNLKRLKKVVYQCIAWQPNPLERLFIVEYLLTLREIKGKVAALKELEDLKKYIPEFRYKDMISSITNFNEENTREAAREE